ncbi:MAG: hypothetical protein JXR83_09510 [Deltaproteobacteria bacterium]|nr:hypothetical protein [Deltaproteobacteria bacterium]
MSFWTALSTVLWIAGVAPADTDVAVVISSHSGAFNSALQAAQAELGPRAEVFDLSAGDNSALANRLAMSSAKVMLAIGPQSADFALADAAKRPIVHCLLPHAQRRNLDRSTVRGVPLAVDVKQVLAAIADALPGARRITVVFDPAESERTVAQAEAAARTGGLTLRRLEVSRGAEVGTALKAAFRDSDVVWLFPDRAVSSSEALRYMMLKSFERKIPVVVSFEAHARQGGLLALVPDPVAQGRAAARLARLVADGTPITEVPAPEPEALIILNQRTARRLSINIPDAFANRAASVIK